MSKTPGKEEVGSDTEIMDDKAEADKGARKRSIPRKLTAKAAEAASAAPAKKARVGNSSSSDSSSSSSGSSSSSEGKEDPLDKEDAMVAEMLADAEMQDRKEQGDMELAAMKKRAAKRVERMMSKVRAARKKALLIPDIMSSDGDSDGESITKDDNLTARRLAAGQVAKAEAAKRQIAKDIADIEFERRWRNMVARDDPGPAAPRHAPRDVPSEEKTGAYQTAHISQRTQAHASAHYRART